MAGPRRKPTQAIRTEAQGNFTAVLTVTDSKGAFSKAQVSITAGNSKTTAFIDAPGAGLQWKVGQLIPFTGHATDPNQGTLPPSAFLWEIILHHCPSNCHTHPIPERPRRYHCILFGP